MNQPHTGWYIFLVGMSSLVNQLLIAFGELLLRVEVYLSNPFGWIVQK